MDSIAIEHNTCTLGGHNLVRKKDSYLNNFNTRHIMRSAEMKLNLSVMNSIEGCVKHLGEGEFWRDFVT